MCATICAVTPEELFAAHVDKAEKIASTLCWRYKVSGALCYLEEAKSEARLALWRACVNFSPGKQAFEIRKIREHISASFWSPLFGAPAPPLPLSSDPYDNFWIWAIRQIYGRVIDWFRSYRLIKRMAEGESASMVYHERFISMTRTSAAVGVEDGARFHQNDFDECLPSGDRADQYNDGHDRHQQLVAVIQAARLSPQENRVISLAYGEGELSVVEISEVMGITQARVAWILRSAMTKLKAAAQPQPQSVFTTESMERPMLRPGI